MAGGQSGNPASLHFADQIERYASGRLRRIYFSPADLKGHVARRYAPGGGPVAAR
jgi:acyl-homoserine-lactone acylase